MKFTSYQKAITPNVMNPPAVQAPKDTAAYGTGGKEWESLGAAFGQINKVLSKQQDDMDAADVMEAKNKIKTSLMNQFYGENGLFTTGVGENAKGLADRTNAAIKQTYDEISKDYNGRVRYALRGSFNENMDNWGRIAMGQEKKEKEQVDEGNYVGNLQSNINIASKMYDKPEMINSIMQDTETLTLARAKQLGLSGQQIAMNMRKNTTDIVAGAVKAAIANDDYDRAAEMLKTNQGSMNQDVHSQLYSMVNKEQKQKATDIEVDDIVKACTLPDGTIDIAKARERVEQICGRNAVKTVYGGGYLDNQEIDGMLDDSSKKYSLDPKLLAAIAMTESGGDQSAVSPVGAIGVMQLMPDTAADLQVDPYDKRQNIEGGAKYLRRMLDTFDGNLDLAIAAYNAGPKAVKDHGGIPPYTETQNYVKKVRKYYEELSSKPKQKSGGAPDMTKTYYTVKPGKESEVVGLKNSTWTKINSLAYAFEQKFGKDNDFEPFYITAAAASGGHNDGSKHYDGIAVDIAMDSLKRNPERFDWLQENAPKFGLTPLNEYNGYGNEHLAFGENFHFSDNGNPIQQGVWGESGGRQESAYDPKKYKYMMNYIDAINADRRRDKSIQEEQTVNNIIMNQIVPLGRNDYAGKMRVIESWRDKLPPSAFAKLESWAGNYVDTPRKKSGGIGGVTGMTAAKETGYMKNLENYAIDLDNGGSISAEQRTNAKYAVKALVENNMLSSEDLSDIHEWIDDTEEAAQNRSGLTSILDNQNLTEGRRTAAYRALRDSGLSEIAAAAVMAFAVDTEYLKEDYR